MTETEKLRAMLDELGIDWWDESDNSLNATETKFLVRGVLLKYIDYKRSFGKYSWLEYDDDEPMTPEQVIAALGLHSCRMEREPGSDRLWWCSYCASYSERASDFPYEYCPRCGAKVVSE